jgi:hypothetical protein
VLAGSSRELPSTVTADEAMTAGSQIPKKLKNVSSVQSRIRLEGLSGSEREAVLRVVIDDEMRKASTRHCMRGDSVL